MTSRKHLRICVDHRCACRLMQRSMKLEQIRQSFIFVSTPTAFHYQSLEKRIADNLKLIPSSRTVIAIIDQGINSSARTSITNSTNNRSHDAVVEPLICSDINFLAKIGWLGISFSLSSPLTLDIRFLTFVYLHLFCCTWDLFFSDIAAFLRVSAF